MIDSGAAHSFLFKDFPSSVALQPLSRQGLGVSLVDISYIKTTNVCDISAYFGPGLFYVVLCHEVDKLSSKLVLGIDWFTSINLTI